MSRDIPTNLIDADSQQPRKQFDQAGLDELAQSMAEIGLAVPILVRPSGHRFLIVHGERRWRAATTLGWETIPEMVRELNPAEAHWLSLVENVQRSDLTPIEEAVAFRDYLDAGMTQSDLGRRIGKSQSYIAHKIRLLSLPVPLLSYLNVGALSEGHMRVLLNIRTFYGGVPRRGFLVGPLALDFADRATVFELLRDVRPEDNPPIWMAMPGPGLCDDGIIPLPLTAACGSFMAWLADHEGIVPSWAVAAFWWASLAVCQDLSVADLALAIDHWRERIRGAIFLFVLWTQEHIPDDELSAMEWWGCRADLRHAGLDPKFLTEEQRIDAAEFFSAIGSVPYPSTMQAWGFEHERYQVLVAAREGGRS